MEKEQFQIQAMNYLSGIMDDSQRLVFESFLDEHPSFRERVQEMKHTWQLMDKLTAPEPSEDMDIGFYNMLYKQIENQQTASKTIVTQLQEFIFDFWKPQLALGLVVLAIGLATGYYLSSDSSADIKAIEIVENSETEEVREKLVLTLLEQPSANKRLQAVSESTKLNSATEQVINALFATLNNDPNVNVRIAAIASLERYVKKPEVRMGLIQSIGKQESPLVQIALADLMVKLQEKSSVDSMKLLLERPDIDTTVKNKLEQSINHII